MLFFLSPLPDIRWSIYSQEVAWGAPLSFSLSQRCLANKAEFSGWQVVIFATFDTAPSIAVTAREARSRLRET
jgi:hypothetical protein